MTYRYRFLSLLIVDIFIVTLSIFLSYFFRFYGDIPDHYLDQFYINALLTVCICTALLIAFNFYNRMWKYANVEDVLLIFGAVMAGNALSYIFTYYILGYVVPLSVFVLSFETMILLTGTIRLFWRVHVKLNRRNTPDPTLRKALIIGAGSCGTLVCEELKRHRTLQPVAYIDDDPRKHRLRISGIPVLGGRERIQAAVELYGINDIIIAIPSAPQKAIHDIIEQAKLTTAKLKIIPRIDDLINGKVTINTIKDVDVEDLLQRDPIRMDQRQISNYIEGKTVLITGAGGSIGSELCRQIVQFHPSSLVLLGHGENSIFSIETELRRLVPHIRIETVIADIQHATRIENVFQLYRPQVVFHAAAHKHVPLMESNPAEAVKNNIIGTKIMAECADRNRVERFVLISTDKAVNPTSVMGATKRVAEMIVQTIGAHSQTKYAAVRFGNVLGSRGSVIPFFKQQILGGGPVTVTDPRMYRFFMTIPEASQLVIQAGSLVKGGEVFILDMGEPVKIVDLARDLIRLSGLEEGRDIDIVYTGLRPGEKLYEELLTNEEGISKTVHNQIFIGLPGNLSVSELELKIKRLEKLLDGNADQIKDALNYIVPSYRNQALQSN
ncbi:polysaccharide biosynthesis protein [Paenibacillus swuensis]|uniref:Polysaccharide biosynthesis protein n=1 Tax=Paenibacillus swuensis TaxID=1178515 RepID=A0A172TEV2_9BACL|nr:nucleoside-diphosphate sugar epimerase/dehydratase [Paenibacillus swuensis]ANE45417.1 polysaccharide biosynthesis protein [Paenibacillus swuensis]